MNTPRRTFRIDNDTYDAAKAAADERGESLSDVVRNALADYAKTASAVACALVALLLLSGCGGSSQAASEPQARVPATSAPVVSASASVAPVETPAAPAPISGPIGSTFTVSSPTELGTINVGATLSQEGTSTRVLVNCTAASTMTAPLTFDGTWTATTANGATVAGYVANADGSPSDVVLRAFYIAGGPVVFPATGLTSVTYTTTAGQSFVWTI